MTDNAVEPPPLPKAQKIAPSDPRWWHVAADQVSLVKGQDPARLPRVRFDREGRPFCY